MALRIYIDTSIIGGYFDDEFTEATRILFRRFEKGEVLFVISDLLELEMTKAPLRVKHHFSRYPLNKFEKIFLSEEAIVLADQYIKEKVVGRSSLEDCRHIALATVAKVDVVASWNFKHIVNFNRIKGYNSVNLRMGYPALEIRSPLELTDED